MSGSSAVKSSTASHVAALAARYGNAHTRGRSATAWLGAYACLEDAVVCNVVRNGVLVLTIVQSCSAKQDL